jgi:hypothetical protein
MGDQVAGERELATLPAVEPALKARTEATDPDVRTMGFRSYEAGYLRDAARYLSAAVEDDPLDFEAILKLAWTYNLLHDDSKAIPLFAMAARAPMRP